jgi:carboxyvinyl-carboxyphosphonate phosphorylmutase
VHPGSVFDPISARIAEDLGFEVGMFAGSIASFTVLGAPDIIVLTLSEFADQAHRICRAGNLPLLCDADHGYGNALNVMRTVEELETAGVAALSIEDTALPQPFGSQGKAQLLSVDEGVGKMRAALEARRDSGLVICGRTSAASMTGVADAIVRAKAYAAAGVDAIFLVGVKTRADLDAIADEIKLPLILGGAAVAFGFASVIALVLTLVLTLAGLLGPLGGGLLATLIAVLVAGGLGLAALKTWKAGA